MQTTGTNSRPTPARVSNWFWFALGLIAAGSFCNQWYAHENSRAKAGVDQIQAGLDRQRNNLTAQSIEVSKENDAALNLISDQKKMLTQPAYSQSEFDRRNDQIKAAQANANGLLSDYQSATAQYAAASQRYAAACDQYIQLSHSRTHQNILWTSVLLGGAMIALLMAVIGQASRWHGPIQPA
jgi:hypothetical protein